MSVQTEHFEARERNVQLLAENARLQQELSDLHTSHTHTMAALKREHLEAEAKMAQKHAKEIGELKPKKLAQEDDTDLEFG